MVAWFISKSIRIQELNDAKLSRDIWARDNPKHRLRWRLIVKYQ